MSNVINGKEGVSEDTRQRILETMEQHNFQPRITKSANDSIGAIIKFNKSNPLSSPYVNKVLEGVYEILFNHGFNITIVPLETIPKDKDGFRVFCMKHKFVACIFINLSLEDTFIYNFEDVIPIATVGTNFNSKKIISVRCNNMKGAEDAVSYLIHMGHKKIAFVAPDFNHQDYRERFEGYTKALNDAGIEERKDLVATYSLDYIETVIESLLIANPDKPTAIFTCDDQEALKISDIIRRKGIAIPDDLSIIGFDDYDFSRHLVPPLTTVRQPILEMGKRCTLMLMNSMNGIESEGTYIKLDTELVVRQSVKRLD